MKRLACLAAFLTLSSLLLEPAGLSAGQQSNGGKQQSADVKAYPMPPDLVHFKAAGCSIYTMVKESAVDAKTGKLVPIKFVQIVQPTAQYDDNRQNWAYTSKDGKTIKALDEFPDTDEGLQKAVAACQEWRKFVQRAAASVKAGAAHKDVNDFQPTPAQWTYLYDTINAKFFAGALPYAVIRSSAVATDLERIGWTHFDGNGVPHIIMSDAYITCLDEAVIYLSHEMVHVKLKILGSPNWDQHGQEFQAEMLRLAEAGAFKDSW